MPYLYSVYARIFKEVKARVPSLTNKKGDQLISVLDYGSGLGSGIWAAADTLGAQKLAAVEPNVAMRKLGKFLGEHSRSEFLP